VAHLLYFKQKMGHAAESSRYPHDTTYGGIAMLTPEERALLLDVQDRLLELYVLRDQANRTGNPEGVSSVEADIADAEAERDEIRLLDTVEAV
jgi:hypothetical protein